MEGFDSVTVKTMLRFLYGEFNILDSLNDTSKKLYDDADDDWHSGAHFYEAQATNAAGTDTAYTGADSITNANGGPNSDVNTDTKTEPEAEPETRIDTAQDNGYTIIFPETAKDKLEYLVRVNCLAEFYDIESLRLASLNAIDTFLKNHYDTAAFVAAARIVADEAGDASIHHLFATTAAGKCAELVNAGLDLELFSSLHGFASIMMQKMVANNAAFEEAKTAHKSFGRFLAEELESTKASIARCVKHLEDSKPCSHCNETPNVYIENFVTYSHVVRCRGCYPDKHWSSDRN